MITKYVHEFVIDDEIIEIKQLEVTNKNGFVTFLDLLHFYNLVPKHKHNVRKDFEKLVKWFFDEYLKETNNLFTKDAKW